MTELSIKGIAANVGFHDPYYFSRQFSRIMSISPTAYKLQNKG
ncbi:helix-turn-helix domain-containing protein [Paenibacillus sp. 1001270B_150601_E10]|nr:AraC family transcriptional regulator [Paenibacillus sp. 1001270B_150601_E10]